MSRLQTPSRTRAQLHGRGRGPPRASRPENEPLRADAGALERMSQVDFCAFRRSRASVGTSARAAPRACRRARTGFRTGLGRFGDGKQPRISLTVAMTPVGELGPARGAARARGELSTVPAAVGAPGVGGVLDLDFCAFRRSLSVWTRARRADPKTPFPGKQEPVSGWCLDALATAKSVASASQSHQPACSSAGHLWDAITSNRRSFWDHRTRRVTACIVVHCRRRRAPSRALLTRADTMPSPIGLGSTAYAADLLVPVPKRRRRKITRRSPCSGGVSPESGCSSGKPNPSAASPRSPRGFPAVSPAVSQQSRPRFPRGLVRGRPRRRRGHWGGVSA